MANTTADFGRFLTDQSPDPGAVHVLNQLDRTYGPEGAAPDADFGVAGGVSEAMREAEAGRIEAAPQGTTSYEGAFHFVAHDPNDDAPDNLGVHGPMNPPRHDRFAAENSGVLAERVVPYTATNANPSYDDGAPGIGAGTGVSETEEDEDGEEYEAVPPPKSALKGEWVDYVVANYEIDREAAEVLTKDELISAYGE